MSQQPKFGEQEFTEDELRVLRKRLEEKIGPEYISYRQSGGGDVPYITTNTAIFLANDIFNYTGWASQVINLSVDYCDEVNSKFSAGVSAIVRVQLKDGTHHEDIGYGTSENQRTKAEALHNAKKSAVSDGVKRALRVFGNALGNSLYDKSHQAEVKKMKKNPLPGMPGAAPKAPLPGLNNQPPPQQNNQQNNQYNRNNFNNPPPQNNQQQNLSQQNQQPNQYQQQNNGYNQPQNNYSQQGGNNFNPSQQNQPTQQQTQQYGANNFNQQQQNNFDNPPQDNLNQQQNNFPQQPQNNFPQQGGGGVDFSKDPFLDDF